MTSEAAAQAAIREAAAYIGITLFRNNSDAVALRAKIMESYV